MIALITLTWQQLAESIGLVTFFSLLTYSRRNLFALQPILTIGAAILVLGTSLWNYLVMTSVWYGGENIFDHPSFGPIPRIVQFCCSSAGVLVLSSAIVAIVWLKEYSLRQRLSYLLASLFLALPLGFMALVPSRFQAMVDSWGVP